MNPFIASHPCQLPASHPLDNSGCRQDVGEFLSLIEPSGGRRAAGGEQEQGGMAEGEHGARAMRPRLSTLSNAGSQLLS